MITPARDAPPVNIPARTPRFKESDIPLGLRMGVLGKKWTLLILRHVATEGRPSFSGILHAMPRLSRRILSIRLKELQRERYVEKIISEGNPRRTCYSLTPKGRDAIPVLHAFSELVRRYGEGVSVARGASVAAEAVCFTHPDVRAPAHRSSNPVASAIGAPLPAPPKVVMYKDQCEKCRTPLTSDAEAYVCSYECTWCRSCAEGFGWACPNCNGRLHPRPRLSAASGVSRGLRPLGPG
jgi:uncharacterized protein